MTKVEIGKEIRAQRKGLDLTQESLGQKVGVTGRYIQALEVGRRAPSKSLAAKLSAVLEIPVANLIEVKDNSEKFLSQIEDGKSQLLDEAMLRQKLIEKLLHMNYKELKRVDGLI